MSKLLKPLVARFLRRPEDEVDRRSRVFRIAADGDREWVQRLGRAFLGGYHSMLAAAALDDVNEEGARVEPHYRPFFFEGAAMGYLPRGYWMRGCTKENAERDLLGMAAEFRYLYFVGLGFWYGFRHKNRPEKLRDLAGHLDPLHAALAWDGFGFKIGFFDLDPGRWVSASRTLARCPEAEQPWAYQGFGRAAFFVFMDDDAGFERIVAHLPPARRRDLEFGRSLARGFTGVDRPDLLVDWIAAAGGPALRIERKLGITWALTARRMNDPAYFASCLARGSVAAREALAPLPDLCERAREGVRSYGEWQERTREGLRGTG